MTRLGRFAGSWRHMPIPVMLTPIIPLIGTPLGYFVFGSAGAASPLLAGLLAFARNLAKRPLTTEPFVLPSLTTLTAPAPGIGVPPQTLAAVANASLCWPVALLAALAVWLVRLRHARWRRIAVDHGRPAADLSDFWPKPAAEPALFAPPRIIAPAAPEKAQPQGADLAARARFVAMTFAFPEAGPARDGPAGWPLHMICQPTRFTLTLRHAAVRYRLEFRNRGAEPLGPLMIRAELVAAADLVAQNSRAAQNRPVEFAADALPLCHYLDGLPVGDSIELTGELRLPLARITAMRLGAAELLVPLMRLCAESAGVSRPALSVSACFAIGLPPLSSGGGIQPFRLDCGPRIWRKPTARRLFLPDLS